MNEWNRYQHEHKGLGWSKAEMSRNYHADKEVSKIIVYPEYVYPKKASRQQCNGP